MTHMRPQIATFALRRLRPRDHEDEASQPLPRGRAWFVVIAALIGTALALGLAAYLIFGSETGTASVAAQHFCDALVAHDYATAYADLSQSQQQQGSEPQFAASQLELDRLRGRATACAFTGTQVSGAHATFTLRITRAGTGTGYGTMHMIQQGGKWKVDDYDSNVI